MGNALAGFHKVHFGTFLAARPNGLRGAPRRRSPGLGLRDARRRAAKSIELAALMRGHGMALEGKAETRRHDRERRAMMEEKIGGGEEGRSGFYGPVVPLDVMFIAASWAAMLTSAVPCWASVMTTRLPLPFTFTTMFWFTTCPCVLLDELEL
jgi:hypothetical protein